MAADQKVNCNVQNVADGSYLLVFTVQGTQRVVGELRIAADENYLKVIGQLFTRWIGMRRGKLHSAVSNILNGRHGLQG